MKKMYILSCKYNIVPNQKLLKQRIFRFKIIFKLEGYINGKNNIPSKKYNGKIYISKRDPS